MTTEQYKVFNKGNGINARLQNSIDLPTSSHLILQNTDLNKDDLHGKSAINSNYIKIVKQTQTPPSVKESCGSMKIEKYREWRDVDKCLNASLD